MFSFHKPRVYRSTEGCCICRAKSSSSRFTDSKKYEDDSMKCFDLKQPRYGEICNACVLLVKRFKRLPMGSTRHWGHVVDARAGPGMKSLTKFKKLKDEDCSSSTTQSSSKSSLIPEKFSKIFKKNKKKTAEKDAKKDKTAAAKRLIKSSSPPSSWDTQSLPPTPDSLDSDYEETAEPASASVVQYQTTTRSSSFRARIRLGVGEGPEENGGGGGSRDRHRTCSNRRKRLLPQKNRSAAIDNVQFFDAKEWTPRRSCCGLVYENDQLGAIIVDTDNYMPCWKHVRKPSNATPAQIFHTHSQTLAAKPTTVPGPMPMPVTTVLPMTSAILKPDISSSYTAIIPTISNFNSNPTPALKKHHLFFKRQSECFPQGDMTAMNNPLPPPPPPTAVAAIPTATVTTQTTIYKTDFPQNIKVVSPPSTTAMSTLKTDLISSLSSSNNNNNNQHRQHATKLTTIPPTSIISTTTATTTNISKANSFMHKIKSETGKIVKHSIDKINTLRLKQCDLNDMKQQHIIKTVDKSYVLSKPVVSSSLPSSVQKVNSTNISKSMPTILSNVAVPNQSSSSSSSSSSSATKFSDNSSDSGFDENLQDRKSVSPLQDDTERKILTRPVQTMFLASGVQIHGHQQNLILAGNEMAAKIFEGRKQQPQHTIHHHHQQNRNSGISSGAAGIKIAQVAPGSQKMRAYNNNNSNNNHHHLHPIPVNHHHHHHQLHLSEVGTTITPSCSLASAGMIAITPTTSGNRKMSSANNLLATSSSSSSNIYGNMSSSNNVSSLNQKIILVKTKYNTTTSSNSISSNTPNNNINNHNNNNLNHSNKMNQSSSMCKN